MPINKALWAVLYCLWMTGWALLAFGAFFWLLDTSLDANQKAVSLKTCLQAGHRVVDVAQALVCESSMAWVLRSTHTAYNFASRPIWPPSPQRTKRSGLHNLMSNTLQSSWIMREQLLF